MTIVWGNQESFRKCASSYLKDNKALVVYHQGLGKE